MLHGTQLADFELNAIFETEAIEVIKTPVRAPKANAFAERWIVLFAKNALTGSSCLTSGTYTTSLPNTSNTIIAPARLKVSNNAPIPLPVSNPQGPIERRDILHGLIHDYRHVA